MAEHGKRISREEFNKMREAYKGKTEFETQSVLFDRATFERLLSVGGAAGVRVYYGLNNEGQLHPMFVPVDAEGKNIFYNYPGKGDPGDTTIEEYGTACPPFCNDGD